MYLNPPKLVKVESPSLGYFHNTLLDIELGLVAVGEREFVLFENCSHPGSLGT
jgi:hypothetical protein